MLLYDFYYDTLSFIINYKIQWLYKATILNFFMISLMLHHSFFLKLNSYAKFILFMEQRKLVLKYTEVD